MIKINLLESVTDRPSGAARVEDKVSSPLMQTLLMALTVFGLLVVGMGYDFISANAAHEVARLELANQKRINLEMMAVNKEQLDLERKAQDIQSRIDAIKRLRESQQGPGSVLREIKNRFDAVPGLYLKSIEQKEGELIVKGESPNEASVTRFGQSMEFSSGLFTNLNIETQREVAKGSTTSTLPGEVAAAPVEVISFTVKCNFAKSQTSTASNPPANQVALKK
ncbi:MAG: PilN domain-containing protein [Pyrinomonadaceae bacterium]